MIIERRIFNVFPNTFFSYFLLSFLSVEALKVDLTGEWLLQQAGHSKVYKAQVPGDVYSDLYANKIIENPLYGDNVIKYKSIGRQNWIYSRQFSVDRTDLSSKRKILKFEGIDTISDILLNGKLILQTNNMFMTYYADVTDVLREENTIEVFLTSPVLYAQNKSSIYEKEYGHKIPLACPPEIYNGECHANMIRKAQYSFSWDWGPSVATLGIWKPITLHFVEKALINSISWTTERKEEDWHIMGEVSFITANKESFQDTCNLSIGDKISKKFEVELPPTSNITLKIPFEMTVSKEKVNLWWPNGEGNQTLYPLTIQCFNQEITEEIGFRNIQLVQTYVNPQNFSQGRNFYFKVNDRPVFLKGSNWIPVSMFLGSNHSSRMQFLLDSASEVGMNALRVWGGGIYETEEFYRYANKKGILIWQDMMFACALYPIDRDFKKNVRKELQQQIWRLRKHPSILLYAGDNELETAIRGHWWKMSDFSEQEQIADYLKLRYEVIQPVIRAVDPTRTLVLSSPSNGKAGEKPSDIPKNPDDPRYGDIHYYKELINQWHDNEYTIPRCATEYGVQSMPFKSTMLDYMPKEDWYYSNPTLTHRQHHPTGYLTNLLLVYTHFPISDHCPTNSKKNILECEYITSNKTFLDRYAYFSQAHQAIMYKVQTEHYRRYRNRLTKNGRGNTMCALYWQLNDVWAAPTWSSIDFNLQWKMSHYEARRFFAPIAVSLFSSSSFDLGLAVINDTPEVLKKHTIVLKQYAWAFGFQEIYKQAYTITVEAHTGKEITLNRFYDYDSDYLYTATIHNETGTPLGYEAILLPDKLYETDFSTFGNVSIETVTRIDGKTFLITIKSDSLSPLTWLSAPSTLPSWFSDNGFTMTQPTKQVYLYLQKPQEVSKEIISVCNLKTCGL